MTNLSQRAPVRISMQNSNLQSHRRGTTYQVSMPKLSQMVPALPKLCPVILSNASSSTQKQILQRKEQETKHKCGVTHLLSTFLLVLIVKVWVLFSTFLLDLKTLQTFLTLTLTLDTFLCGQFPLNPTPYSPSVYAFEFSLTSIILWCIYQLLNFPELSGKKKNISPPTSLNPAMLFEVTKNTKTLFL